MVVGLVMTVASLFLGNTLLGGVAKTLLLLGLLFLPSVVACCGFRAVAIMDRATQSAVPLTRPPQGRFPPRDDVVDRTVTELLRESARSPAGAGNKG